MEENSTLIKLWDNSYKCLFPIIKKHEIGKALIIFIVFRTLEYESLLTRKQIREYYIHNKDKISDTELKANLLKISEQKCYNTSEYSLVDFKDSILGEVAFFTYLKAFSSDLYSEFIPQNIGMSIIYRIVNLGILQNFLQIIYEYDVNILSTLIREIGGYQFRQNQDKYIKRKFIDNEEFIFILCSSKKKTERELVDYLCVWNFKEGFARFITKQGRWGYIAEDTEKQLLLPSDYFYVEDFSCGRALVQIENNYCGYIDYEGNLIIPTKYCKAQSFDNDKAIVDIDWSVNIAIDIFGNILPEYIEIYENDIKEWDAMHQEVYDDIDRASKEARAKKEKQDLFLEMLEAFSDDEENIMRALSEGRGDVFGF